MSIRNAFYLRFDQKKKSKLQISAKLEKFEIFLSKLAFGSTAEVEELCLSRGIRSDTCVTTTKINKSEEIRQAKLKRTWEKIVGEMYRYKY